MQKLNIIILNVLILCLSGILKDNEAADPGCISGIVKDARTGNPLSGVNITLEETHLSASSDNNGYFRIEAVPSKSYTLKLACTGYAHMTLDSISVNSDEQQPLEFILVPLELKTAETEPTHFLHTGMKSIPGQDFRGIRNTCDPKITTMDANNASDPKITAFDAHNKMDPKINIGPQNSKVTPKSTPPLLNQFSPKYPSGPAAQDSLNKEKSTATSGKQEK